MGKPNLGLSAVNPALGVDRIKQLTIRHRSIARTMVAGGLTPSDICNLYNLSPSQVSIITGSPAFQSEMRRIEEGEEKLSLEAKQEILNLRPLALAAIEEDLLADVEKSERLRELRQKSAFKILEGTGDLAHKESPFDRGGVTNQTQININLASKEELRDQVFGLITEET